jgi:hypothetical protein
MRPSKIKIGDKFDLLTIDRKDHINRHGKIVYVCKCICGNEVKKTQQGLAKMVKAGSHINCGCGQKNSSWNTRRKELIDMQRKIPDVIYKEVIIANVSSWSCY